MNVTSYSSNPTIGQQELDITLEEKPDKMDDKEWAKINRQACGTIRLCLAKEQKYSIMRETSAKKLWDTLEEKFLTKSLENRLYMKKKLYRFTYAPKFEDEDKALLLLNSLLDEYDHLTTTLLHRKDTVIFDAVCSALYRSKTRKKDKRDHLDTIAEVLTVRGRSHSNKSGRRIKHDEESDFSLVGMATSCHTDEWILDSGCTYHMRPNKDWFSSLKELEGGVVFMGNDSACKTMGVGTIQLKHHDGSIQVLTDVHYVLSLKKNLISLGVLESKELTITLRDGLLKVVAGVLTVMKGIRRNNLYYLNGSTIIGSTSRASVKDADSKATRLWHMRLGHAGEKALQNLAKQGLLKDNGTEYKNDPFLQVCQDEGIVRHFTIRDTPQQNGMAEHMNQIILEKVRCMLSNAGLGKEFWAEAVSYTCHLINRLPSAAINGETPIEIWTGKPVTDYDSLHVFGSTAYYHVKKSKLNPRVKKALFVGITGGVKGYRLWCPYTRKIVFSRDVTFDESTLMKNNDSQKDDKTSSTLQ
ncbi:hypothetical protein CXB51_003033 [Gossypium anomalum]|uniref:Integrase catalytic domain-containing protein n=1 Tax=Gossypium anomalum TaxID=47600 RepID=A0A8J5Z6P1_9ROSI|nr:hypothetical protein CXB51_003033 [Gossypium anomalum]